MNEKPLRRIRSFVLRQGRLTKGQQRALDTLLPHFGIKPGEDMLDLDAVFQRSAPRFLEIGFGNGHALVEMARANPDQDYIGVEVHRPGVGNLLLQLEKYALHNVRIISADALEVLQKQIPDCALDGVLLFFPDPWHKKRHHKRRIVQPEFIELVHRKLKLGGYLHMATDWEDYAEHMMSMMTAAEGFRNLAGAGEFSDRPDYRPLTKFEQRGQRLGHGVWDLIFERVE